MGKLYGVTTSATDALDYKERNGWTIENKSDVAIQLIWDGSTVTASGGSNPGFTLNVNDKLSLTSGARDMETPWARVSVIHSGTGTKNISVIEW